MTTPCTRPRFFTIAEPRKSESNTDTVHAMPASYGLTRPSKPKKPTTKPVKMDSVERSVEFRCAFPKITSGLNSDFSPPRSTTLGKCEESFFWAERSSAKPTIMRQKPEMQRPKMCSVRRSCRLVLFISLPPMLRRASLNAAVNSASALFTDSIILRMARSSASESSPSRALRRQTRSRISTSVRVLVTAGRMAVIIRWCVTPQSSFCEQLHMPKILS
mmetsp:Transcript_35007/g.89945  ORF Transcript_35007/g.89945 Transcript_35007/m.89945 type:complete len:218 (+) Transcript_35007:1326-1979(+)